MIIIDLQKMEMILEEGEHVVITVNLIMNRITMIMSF
jgi:hypothetical protein